MRHVILNTFAAPSGTAGHFEMVQRRQSARGSGLRGARGGSACAGWGERRRQVDAHEHRQRHRGRGCGADAVGGPARAAAGAARGAGAGHYLRAPGTGAGAPVERGGEHLPGPPPGWPRLGALARDLRPGARVAERIGARHRRAAPGGGPEPGRAATGGDRPRAGVPRPADHHGRAYRAAGGAGRGGPVPDDSKPAGARRQRDLHLAPAERNLPGGRSGDGAARRPARADHGSGRRRRGRPGAGHGGNRAE